MEWAERAQKLRTSYVSAAGDRVARMRVALERLAGADAAALRQMQTDFHQLAGTGTTYGFPEITAIALQGQEICAAALETIEGDSQARLKPDATNAPDPAQTYEACAEALAGIERALAVRPAP